MSLKNGFKNYFIKNRNQTDIEAEEVFLDSEAARSIEDKGKMEKPISSKNFIIFFIVILLTLFGLFCRSGYLQIIRGDYYYQLAQGNRLRVYSIVPPRGIIYDKEKKPLVYNVSSFALVANLADFLEKPKASQKNDLKQAFSIIADSQDKDKQFSDIDVEKQVNNLLEKIELLEDKSSQIVLLSDIDRSVALILESRANKWTGLRIEEIPKRKYLEGEYFAHLIGYTGRINTQELKKHPNYNLNGNIGKGGLEKYYEEILRGEPGKKQVEVNSLGEIQKIAGLKKPEPGNSLVLNIDRDLQKKIQDSLTEIMSQISKPGDKKQKAAAVALNPQNGKVLAAVSLPSFDNNLFSGGISEDQFKKLNQDPSNPFLNRFSAGQYPPGSLIKPLMAAAGLSEGINPYQTIDCHGRLAIPDKYTGKIHYFNDWKAHGKTDMIKAIAESCNVYFYILGGGYENKDGLGADTIQDYLHKFGLEKKTKIDLPEEEDGLIPDKNWMQKTKERKWHLGDTYNLSIGQGDVLVTPLQITNALSVVANGGVLYQPQIVDKVIDFNKKLIKEINPKILENNFLAKEDTAIVRQGMRQAVKSGSAVRLNSLEVALAGKTGTAQFGSEGKTHSWFSVFGPYEKPEIILTILVEGGGGGHEVALPVAEKVLKWYFKE